MRGFLDGPAYDQWLTGGDPGIDREKLVVCENPECERFKITEERDLKHEYGQYVDDLDCPECGEALTVV